MLIILLFIRANSKNSCQSYFRAHDFQHTVLFSQTEANDALKFWMQIQTRTQRLSKNPGSALLFADTIKRVLFAAKNIEKINLSRSLRTYSEELSTEHTYAALLYILSLTASGRDLIRQTIPFLNGSKHEFDYLHLKFKLTRNEHHGELDFFATDFDTPPSILISRKLKFGVATLVFAHELVHVHNNTKLKLFKKIKSLDLASALDEIIAYKYEQKILSDLLKLPEFSYYKHKYDNDYKQSLYTFTDQEIARKLINEYGLDPVLVNDAFKLYYLEYLQ